MAPLVTGRGQGGTGHGAQRPTIPCAQWVAKTRPVRWVDPSRPVRESWSQSARIDSRERNRAWRTSYLASRWQQEPLERGQLPPLPLPPLTNRNSSFTSGCRDRKNKLVDNLHSFTHKGAIGGSPAPLYGHLIKV